jgi:hypothetical protein
MLLLATTRPSEEVDHELFMVAGAMYCSACLVGVLALIFAFTLRRYPGVVLILSFLTFALGIFPFVFGSYIYHIDYIAVGRDGTRASPPFWRALWILALPLFAGLTLTLLSAIPQRQKLRKLWRRISS